MLLTLEGEADGVAAPETSSRRTDAARAATSPETSSAATPGYATATGPGLSPMHRNLAHRTARADAGDHDARWS